MPWSQIGARPSVTTILTQFWQTSRDSYCITSLSLKTQCVDGRSENSWLLGYWVALFPRIENVLMSYGSRHDFAAYIKFLIKLWHCWPSTTDSMLAMPWHRAAYSKFAPSQWETLLQSNAVCHWLSPNLESALLVSLAIWWGTWINMCMHPANESWRYTVTPFLIGGAHTQKDPWKNLFVTGPTIMLFNHLRYMYMYMDNFNSKWPWYLFRFDFVAAILIPNWK